MSTGFEIPSHEVLIAEQALVQAEKFQGRLLAEYSNYIFPGQSWREPHGSAIVDFVRPIIGSTDRVTLDGVIAGLIEAKASGQVNWVDMGGGRALPMRQLGIIPDFKQRLKMTNVDLFNFGLEGLTVGELELIEEITPGITEPDAGPNLIADNVETVTLPEPADIITSIEAIQYLNNPLQALSNWYNQLADNGIMLVATEHDWASWIRYSAEPGRSDQDEAPTKHFLGELSRADINYAVTEKSDSQWGFRPDVDPNRIRIMAIQKKPGTSLRVTRPVTKVWVNPDNYKAAYYEASTTEAAPIVEVVDARTALGTVSLGMLS